MDGQNNTEDVIGMSYAVTVQPEVRTLLRKGKTGYKGGREGGREVGEKEGKEEERQRG